VRAAWPSSPSDDVTVLADPATSRARRPFSLTRSVAWHPEWWVYVVAGAAWVVMVLISLGTGGGPSTGHSAHAGAHTGAHSAHAGAHAETAVSDSFATAWSMAWSHWVLMVAAMMLPVLAPQVRTLAMRSLWPRRQRSAAFFVVGYAVVWVVAGGALLAALVALGVEPLGLPWLIGILLVAAVWQVSTPRKRVMRRCGSLRLGAATGLSADLNCARVGVRAGGRCLVTCGPLMLAMVASHSLLLMAGLLAVMLSERSRGPDPRRRVGRPLEAWAIVGLAVVAGAVATVQ